MKFNNNNNGLVFSTDHGRMCPECDKPIDQCACGNEGLVPETDGIVRVSRQTKGRKGKGVTIITGLPMTAAELKRYARELKARCGCGGTVKDNTIEIQGDHRDALIEILQSKGHTAKRAGG